MTVAQDDSAVEPVNERLPMAADLDTVAFAVAAGFGLVAGVLVGVSTALALATGTAALAIGLGAALTFAVTTLAVFEAGRRTGAAA